MDGKLTPDKFARSYLQEEVHASDLSSLPKDLRKALDATCKLLGVLKNIQTAHTDNALLNAATDYQICIQAAESLPERIEEGKDAVAPVLDEIRLAVVDKDVVSFGMVSGITAFDVVLEEGGRTSSLIEMARKLEDELADTLSSFFPSPPTFEAWKSLTAKLEKEALRAGSRRLKKVESAETDSETQTENDKHPNGPEPPNLLWGNGVKNEIAVMPWRLISYMWNKNNEKESEVTLAVWSDQITDTTLRSTINRANNAMVEVPLTESSTQKQVTSAGKRDLNLFQSCFSTATAL